ncbi:MAG: branched-chain alpha-keto acid dehydrogenase subunit E2, partial [Marinomonas sp.]
MANIMIWDWPVRLLHWLMVLLFTGLIVTGKGDGDYMDWHFYMGYGLS